MTTLAKSEKCTLFVTRAFGVDFMVHFDSYASAWVSILELFRQIELVEGEEPTITNSWDSVTGYQTSCIPASKSPKYDHSLLSKLWINQPGSFIYFIGGGNGYQIVLLKGLVYKPLNNECIHMTGAEAVYFLNTLDEIITIKKTKYRDVYALD